MRPTGTAGGSALADRLPLSQLLRDQLRAPSFVASVEDAQVLRLGAQVHTDRPRIHLLTCVRTRRKKTVRAIEGLQPDLPRPLQLRRVRIQGPFAPPEVEDSRRVLLLLRGFAPVSGRQAPVFLPGAAGDLQHAVAVPGDAHEAHRGRLLRAALRQGQLPPQALDARESALVLYRLAQLLVDDSDLGRRRLFVPDTREAEEIGGKLRALRMEDERPAHAEDAAEEAGFEDDVVPRGRLTRSLRVRRGARGG